ncbi:hypothetical protein EB001_18655 [bacterium]|nr:hypothetical protein [bacterium]
MNAKNDALVEHLLLQNAIEIADIDLNTGKTYYKITDKLQEVAPHIYAELEDQFKDHLFRLDKRGPKAMLWRLGE